MMSAEEVLLAGGGFVAGPVWWLLWLTQMARIQRLHLRRTGLMVIVLALVAGAAGLLTVLLTAASYDVVDAPQYVFMYLMLGLAWVRLVSLIFPFVGLSPRDDIAERANHAAAAAMAGALVGVMACYAGGNIGDGPGWQVVVLSSALSTGTLLAAWAVLAQLTAVADAVAIDRDRAAGVRLGSWLLACGLILGRGVAGDWVSASATVNEFAAVLPAVGVLLAAAIVVERIARPTPQRPSASVMQLGVLPAIVWLSAAAYMLRLMGWPA